MKLSRAIASNQMVSLSKAGLSTGQRVTYGSQAPLLCNFGDLVNFLCTSKPSSENNIDFDHVLIKYAPEKCYLEIHARNMYD